MGLGCDTLVRVVMEISSSWLFVTAVWDVSQCFVVHFHFHLLTYDMFVTRKCLCVLVLVLLTLTST
jgi:hypothetical protein